jgi:hypothetical protein
MKTLSFEEFVEKYKPKKNHIDSNAAYDGCMFETYGPEVEFVLSQMKFNTVWTIINCPDEESWLIPGYHYVDRFGYFVCEEQYEDDEENTIQVNDNEMLTTTDAAVHCYKFAQSIGIQLSANEVSDYYATSACDFEPRQLTVGAAKYRCIELLEEYLSDNDIADELDDDQQNKVHDYFSSL